MPNTHAVRGSGSIRVIALHGWFGHANGWGPFADVIDTTQCSYAFMDARGYGGMRDADGPLTMEQVAEDALALADHLQWPQFFLMGHSMAGVAIQHALLKAPERVQGLVAVTPVSAAGVQMDAQGVELFTSAKWDPQARRTIINVTTGQRLSDHWLDQMMASTQRRSTDEAVGAYFQSWSGASFVSRIQGNTTPVLVLAGEHDPALGESTCRSTWMQHYPNATLKVVPGAGHYPMDETPVFLATLVENFLREQTAH